MLCYRRGNTLFPSYLLTFMSSSYDTLCEMWKIIFNICHVGDVASVSIFFFFFLLVYFGISRLFTLEQIILLVGECWWINVMQLSAANGRHFIFSDWITSNIKVIVLSEIPSRAACYRCYFMKKNSNYFLFSFSFYSFLVIKSFSKTCRVLNFNLFSSSCICTFPLYRCS